MAANVTDYNKIIYGEADVPGASFDALRQQLAAFNLYYAQVDELIAEEGLRVAARITQNGLNSGARPHMPVPTGRRFENEATFVLTIAECKISELPGVSDRLGLLLPIGWNWPQAG